MSNLRSPLNSLHLTTRPYKQLYFNSRRCLQLFHIVSCFRILFRRGYSCYCALHISQFAHSFSRNLFSFICLSLQKDAHFAHLPLSNNSCNFLHVSSHKIKFSQPQMVANRHFRSFPYTFFWPAHASYLHSGYPISLYRLGTPFDYTCTHTSAIVYAHLFRVCAHSFILLVNS